jgi:hypothetical protein
MAASEREKRKKTQKKKNRKKRARDVKVLRVVRGREIKKKHAREHGAQKNTQRNGGEARREGAKKASTGPRERA